MIYYDNILKTVESGFTSINYDTSNLEKGNDESLKTEKVIITFTTSENQKNNIKNNMTNMTTIDLGECEILLRNYYNISNNETLYMKKMDIAQEGSKAIKVEYDVYCKLSGSYLEKLDLTVCKDTKVTIGIPYDIDDDIDKLNISSGYYNDICYTTTSDDGTDISLNDRKTEFANDDKVVCQEGCIFSEYDYENKIAKCKCDVKESPFSIADMNINKEKLLENFKDIKNYVNFKFLKCYKVLFTKEGIMNNYGFFLILIIIFIHLLNFVIFRVSKFRVIEKKIISIASNKDKEISMQEKHLKKSNEFVNKEIFIYRAKKEKNTEKIQLGNKKSIKNKILIKPKVQSSKAKKSNKKINISNNSTSKKSVLNNSKKKNTTKQKSKMKGNPIKKRAIKNAIIRNKINSKNKLIEKNKIGHLKNFIDEEITIIV